MAYRTSADPNAGQPEAPKDGPLLALDATGRKGSDGRPGERGSDGSGTGAAGRSGNDAGPAAPGATGGQIVITLSGDDAREAKLRVTGNVDRQAVDTELDIHRDGEIEIVARGGRGGDGGDGGPGGHGARGKSGSDATRFFSGSDGGPGGDGGDGGNGTSGARGGEGGVVRVRVSEHDTPFLMLVREDVRGGNGGKSGQNGHGGMGGPGGPGGSSYSWTESETYTDSNGQSQTRTTHHSNSGGSTGPSGRVGRTGGAVLRDGTHGDPGRLTIEVIDSGHAYPSRYDLRLVSFRHRNENDDGVYEPEENVFVSHIEVENVGGMPLPAHHDVIVRVVDDGWIAPTAETRLVLPRSLAAGARHVFENDELPLKLRLFRPQATGAPLAAPETIRLLAELPRVRRSFGGFETEENKPQGAILIRFPIEVSPPTALFSLAPGQATRVRWRLSNVAKKAFGLRTDVGRAVGVRFVLGGGEIGERGVHFLDDDENIVPLGAGFDRDVPYLEAEGGLDFEGTIAMPADAVPYTSARLVVSAELGHIDNPARVRAVHFQEITVRVGRPFEAGGADVLLIVNNRTNAAEVAAWEARVRGSGLSVAVWDASLEGSVDVLRGENQYSLVVVLNDHYDTPAGARRASSLIDQATSLALARRGTHVLYVGETPALERLLVPLEVPETTETPTTWFSWPWSQPKPEHLEASAVALAASLAHRYPERRYVVVHAFEPEVERKIAWIRRVKLGSLTAYRSLDTAPGAIQGVSAESDRVHDASFVDAPETNDLVLRALPFAAKLRLLDGPEVGGVTVVDGCADAVVAATLDALITEQRAALAHGWRKSELPRALPLLEELATSEIKRDSGRFTELIAWLDLIARDHPRFWEWLPPFAFLRRGPQLRSVVRKAIARLLERASDETRSAITKRRKELRTAIKRRRKALELTSSNAMEFALDRLAARFATRVTETDASALPQKARVIDREHHDTLAKKERTRAAKATKVLESAADARRTLLRRERCEELLARAKPVRVAAEPPPAGAHVVVEEDLEGSAAALASLR